MNGFTLFKMMSMAATSDTPPPLPSGVFIWGTSPTLTLSGASQGNGLYTYSAGDDAYKHPDSGYRYVIGRDSSGYYIYDYGMEDRIYACPDSSIYGLHAWSGGGQSTDITVTGGSTPESPFVWGTSTALRLYGAAGGANGSFAYIDEPNIYYKYPFMLNHHDGVFRIHEYVESGGETQTVIRYSCTDSSIYGTHTWTDLGTSGTVELTVTDASA